jgi:hypothetical protein
MLTVLGRFTRYHPESAAGQANSLRARWPVFGAPIILFALFATLQYEASERDSHDSGRG